MVLNLRTTIVHHLRQAKCWGRVTKPWVDDEELQRLRDPYFEEHPVAVEFCNGTVDGVVCPIRQECLEYALVNNCQEGVWGGMGETARRALRRRWPPENVKEARPEWVWMTEESALKGVTVNELRDDE
jgi:Transcription factor WhiB